MVSSSEPRSDLLVKDAPRPNGKNDGRRASKCDTRLGDPLAQRFRFDCETTEPANVLVVEDERGLSSAAEALLSVFAPVCADEPAWRKADAATVRWIALEDGLCRVLPAKEATLEEVCLVFEAIFNSRSYEACCWINQQCRKLYVAFHYWSRHYL